MDRIARISGLATSDRRDQFIPVRKEDLFSALIKQGDLADPAERELFWRFARTLREQEHVSLPGLFLLLAQHGTDLCRLGRSPVEGFSD